MVGREKEKESGKSESRMFCELLFYFTKSGGGIDSIEKATM